MPAQHHVQITDHHRMIRTGEIHAARLDAGRQHDLVECLQVACLHLRAQPQLYAGGLQAMVEIAQGFLELFLARDALGHIELPADFISRIEQGHLVAALGCHGCAGKTRRARTDHGHALGCGGRCVDQFGFVHGTRVDQAAGQFVFEHVIQASLVAGDARIDGVRLPGAGLVGPLRVGQQRACQ